jgi:hypothetical protein
MRQSHRRSDCPVDPVAASILMKRDVSGLVALDSDFLEMPARERMPAMADIL